MSFWKDKRVLVTGGTGFLGRHVCQHILCDLGACQVVAARHRDHDLTRPSDAQNLMDAARPDVVVHLAARCGGIKANAVGGPAMFRDNALMGIHTIDAAALAGVRAFVYVGTVCSYPECAPVPFRETALWQGRPDPSNEPYGEAKRALITYAMAMSQRGAFKLAVVLPANLYGPWDNFDPDASHVIPAMVRKFTQAVDQGEPVVTLWGSGAPTRDFLHARDAARGIAMAARRALDGLEPMPINLGTGREVSIKELAGIVARAAGYGGAIEFDDAMPGGQARRCLDITWARVLLGFEPAVKLEDGVAEVVEWWRGRSG